MPFLKIDTWAPRGKLIVGHNLVANIQKRKYCSHSGRCWDVGVLGGTALSAATLAKWRRPSTRIQKRSHGFQVKRNLPKAGRRQVVGWGSGPGLRRGGQARRKARGSLGASEGAGDLQSEDNQGCPHCCPHQPGSARATTGRKASGREEGGE